MESKELIQELRSDAEWAYANEWETPITLGDHLDAAADALATTLAEVERLNEKVRFQNKLLHAPVVDIFPNLTPKEKAEDAEIVRLENELHFVTAERDALKERTRWVPVSEKPPEGDCFVYEANKNKVHFAYAEELDAPNWSVTHWMPFHLPEAPNGAGKEQNDG